MSIEIHVPNVGKVAIQRFRYASGRLGFVAAKEHTREGDFFNLSVDISGVHIDYVILKEYDEAQLINKFLMDTGIMLPDGKPKDLGFNKIYYCDPPGVNWAK